MKLTNGIIICTRNREKDIIQLLSSLQKQSLMPEEITVVDSSTNPLKKKNNFNNIFNNQKFPYTKLIYTHTVPGLTLQRNKGISLTNTNIIHFLDDDCILEKSYLEQMYTPFLKENEYGGGMGYITNVGKKEFNFERIIRSFFLLQKDHSSGKFTASGMPTHPYGTNTFKKVEVVGGCCMSFKKEYLIKNLFDENLTGYAAMEDCDIAKRISMIKPLFFNPLAMLQHNTSPTNRDTLRDQKAMYIKNYRYLFFKNFYPQNKALIIAHWWSIFGLFILACYKKEIKSIEGYLLGLKNPIELQR